ncbi:recombinase family protein [Actinokineospora sp. NBRC 105648]|uniref:recombinase family protein n=1 Tax=Actinokineospora sp. NBRC 105648 TaxID=3032206 RepID=UPI0024A48D50|nr:recombinase family protein [Actinokineospora sp. NBRC 105648]GLZ43766.1 site-specific recombinase DNA invertase Pin [Actinokineospora sp. NBRC 105648]
METQTAATYLRKSVVKDDKDAESIQVQLHYNTKYARSVGWDISPDLTFTDEGISASKGLERPDWLKMLEAIKSGKVKRIVVREQARLSREDIELFIFLKTIEKYSVEVRDSFGHEIKNDLQTKVKGLVDADYAKQVGINVQRKRQYNASLGKHPKHYRRPYGYTSGYESVVPNEAKVIREAARRFLAGETVYIITKDFNNRGIPTAQGKKWCTSGLSTVLGRAENAGLRTYKKEVVAKGAWPTIIDEKTYQAIIAKLSGNAPYSTVTARKHLLVGILVCGLCQTRLSAKESQNRYWCNPSRGGCGKIGRTMKGIDAFMIKLTYEAIKRLPAVENISQPDDTDDRIEALQIEREETVKAKKDGLLDLRTMIELTQDIDAKIKNLRGSQVKSQPLPVNDADAFLNATTDKKRATIKRLFPVVAVKPAPSKGARFKPDQLEF